MPMQPSAVQMIIEEHAALATVMDALRQRVDTARKTAAAPDFVELSAMLFYLNEVPARVHHTNESALLFPRIRKRCPALRPVLDRLEAEHQRGAWLVRELEHGLSAWQVMGDARREAFEILLRAYAEDYFGHMEVEENYVLPVAMDYLSSADWRELDVAFGRQRGALALGHDALYERIVARHRARLTISLSPDVSR